MPIVQSDKQLYSCHLEALLGNGGKAAGEAAITEQVSHAMVPAAMLQDGSDQSQLLPREPKLSYALHEVRCLRFAFLLIAYAEQNNQAQPAAQ